MNVDVIIPTYRPGEKFLRLIRMLDIQTVPVHRIIVMNTEESGYERLCRDDAYLSRQTRIEVHHLSRREFDHARTRNIGILHSRAEIFVCMTDDAVPKDGRLIEALLEALSPERVAASYARQLPDGESDAIEACAREFNYPPDSQIKDIGDLGRLGIKTYFLSNVCAAYKREVYDALGGFEAPAIFNEDMVYAAAAMRAGYQIAYAASAQVYHSHHYTCAEFFRRNFDLGVSQTAHPEVFASLPSEGEGMRLVRQTAGRLWREGHKPLLARLALTSASKYLGYRLGRQYRHLPKALVRRCSQSPYYWQDESHFR